MPLLRTPDGGPWERFTCLNSLRDVDLDGAINEFSAIPVETSEVFPRFFNHYAQVYKINDDFSLAPEGDWFDFSGALP